jgi:hypothetical protein
MKGVYRDSFGRRDVMQPMQHSGAGERPSFAICLALGVGGDNGNGLPCDPSGCSAKAPVWRGKWVELSQAQVRSLGKLGTGILGSFLVSNGVERPDSIFDATVS